MKHTTTSWWETDDYSGEQEYPAQFEDMAGPRGVALVRAWPDGRTTEGWGLTGARGTDGFMPRYMRGEFDPRRTLHGYRQDKWAFALVMRSLSMVCVDIDGKNGGIEEARKLGPLPPTTAETSKSGDGYHLFYLVDELWDPAKGYGLLNDRIGVVQGVDIRATGCVYHHKQQRWNGRPIEMLPDYLAEMLLHREQKIEATNQRITKILNSNDDLEVLMMHDELITELNKPIPTGKRNNTLFAIGSQMQTAQVPNWEELLENRALKAGLDNGEAEKLVSNISKYSA